MLRRWRLLLMRVRPSTPGDGAAVEALLADAGLPLVGVTEAFRTGVVARDDDALVGAAAIEPYGSAGLLRSVVVRPDHRGNGVGQALVSAVEERARALDIQDLFLLTETAEGWFAGLGYSVVDRSSLPPDILASDENTVACSVSAVAMSRSLGAPRR